MTLSIYIAFTSLERLLNEGFHSRCYHSVAVLVKALPPHGWQRRTRGCNSRTPLPGRDQTTGSEPQSFPRVEKNTKDPLVGQGEQGVYTLVDAQEVGEEEACEPGGES